MHSVIAVLVQLFLNVVEALDKIGYALYAPAPDRLELLQNKLKNGESVYDSTDW